MYQIKTSKFYKWLNGSLRVTDIIPRGYSLSVVMSSNICGHFVLWNSIYSNSPICRLLYSFISLNCGKFLLFHHLLYILIRSNNNFKQPFYSNENNSTPNILKQEPRHRYVMSSSRTDCWPWSKSLPWLETFKCLILKWWNHVTYLQTHTWTHFIVKD